jgi:hypothetical protein
MNATVIDRFEIKGRAALEYGAAGVVVIFRHDHGTALPAPGDPVLLVEQDGWSYFGRAEDVRDEPAAGASGLFLRDLCLSDVPIGTQLRWGNELRIPQSAVA